MAFDLYLAKNTTERFTDWARKIYRWCFGFRLELIFNTAQAASKKTTRFKSGQRRPKNIRYANVNP